MERIVVKPGQKSLDMLKKELSYIDNSNLRKSVENIILKTYPDNAIKPASSTGKFHPYCDSGIGGNIRHIKVVFRNIIIIHESIPEMDRDCLIAAATLHDLMKYPDNREHTSKDHPKLIGDMVKAEYESIENNEELVESLKIVERLVRSHMGKWGNPTPAKVDEYMLHIADLLASKTHSQFFFDDNGELILDSNDIAKTIKTY